MIVGRVWLHTMARMLKERQKSSQRTAMISGMRGCIYANWLTWMCGYKNITASEQETVEVLEIGVQFLRPVGL